jgi:hypothetical protein
MADELWPQQRQPMSDPDLGSGLDGEQLSSARGRLVLPGIELAAGGRTIERLRAAEGLRGYLHGFLVLSGALTINALMSGRRCTRVVGVRELVLLDGVEIDSIPVSWDWTVIASARLGLFDERLLTIGRQWPAVMGEILKRAALQTRHAFLQQTISQLPRVEERLLALFWSIADRQGTARADKVWSSSRPRTTCSRR